MPCDPETKERTNSKFDDLYLYTHAEKMFEILAGQRSYDFITNNQFQKLARYQGLTNANVVKAEYDIVYKNVVRRSDNNQMDLNCFFEALEELANRLFSTNTPGRDDSYENLRKLIQIVKKYVPPSKDYYTI